jgi:hypothetical protein
MLRAKWRSYGVMLIKTDSGKWFQSSYLHVDQKRSFQLFFWWLISNNFSFVTLICEEEQDIWNIYNLIRPGDNVRCSTIRKVTTETQTGSKNSQRVHITLTILVETISYDPTVCILHLKGNFKHFKSRKFMLIFRPKHSRERARPIGRLPYTRHWN